MCLVWGEAVRRIGAVFIKRSADRLCLALGGGGKNSDRGLLQGEGQRGDGAGGIPCTSYSSAGKHGKQAEGISGETQRQFSSRKQMRDGYSTFKNSD